MATIQSSKQPKPKQAPLEDLFAAGAQRHARIGPSTMKSRELCPSYQSDYEDTAASRRGDMLHAILETHGHKALGRKEALKLDERDSLALEKICGYTKPFETQRNVVIHREYEFNLKPLEVEGCDLGTGDLLCILGEHADLLDYKMGFWEVDDAEVNLQIWLYVLGVFYNFPKVKTVMAHILQPARDEVSTHLFTRDDIGKMLLRARTVADRVNQLDGVEFNPVFLNCLFCDGKATCTAMHKLALTGAKTADLVMPKGTGKLNPEDFNDIVNAGTILNVVEIIKKWADAMKWRITDLARAGTDIPGHELVEVNGKREVIDGIRAQEISQDHGVDLIEYLSACKPSLTELQKLVAAKAKRGEKEAAKKELVAALVDDGIVVTGNPKSYLNRIETKSKTITPKGDEE